MDSPQPRQAANGPLSIEGKPRVSVVIPTCNRPPLVLRAVRSALGQSVRDIEIIVVIDGPDAKTDEALSEIRDERLHVLSLHRQVGGSEARNIGVAYASAKWVALLDDDDEWMPDKLAIQCRAAEAVGAPYVFVASQFIERTESADRVLPRRAPTPKERFSDYMFVRKGWKSGETFLQTSTWFISRRLLLDVPFTPGLKRCQDLDWLLRATARTDTKVVIIPEVLAVFHHGDGGPRVSRSPDWRFLYDWAAANRRFFSPRAFSFFIATFCVPSAAKQHEGLRVFLFLLMKCLVRGSSLGKCILLFFICWFVPEGRRRRLRNLLDIARSALPGGRAMVFHQSASGKLS